MMHFALALTLLAAPQDAPVGTDDAAFADGLAQLGFEDLAKEVFQKVIAAAGTPEQKIKGELGMARLQSTVARSAGSADKKLALAEEAAKTLEAMLEKKPKADVALEIKKDLASILQLKAEAYASLAKRDRSKLGDAEGALTQAENLWREIEKDLATKVDEKGEKISPRDDAFMLVKYPLIQSLWAYVEVMKDFPEKEGAVKAKLDTLIKEGDEFTWNWPDESYAYEVADIMARAYKYKAQKAARGEDEKLWKECFTNAAMWHALVNKDVAANPYGRELVAANCRSEMRILLEYADGLTGTAAVNRYREAAELPEKTGLMTVFVGLAKEEIGKEIRIEQAKALSRSGDKKRAEAIFKELMAGEKGGSRIIILIIDAQASVGADQKAADIIQAGDAMIKMDAYLLAAQSFRRAIDKLEATKPPPLPQIAECWLKIGQCYHSSDRYFEAERAYGNINFHPALGKALPIETRLEAVEAQIQSRKAVRGLSKDKEYEPWVAQLEEWASKELGRISANMMAGPWDALGRGNKLVEEAVKGNKPLPMEAALKEFNEAIEKSKAIPPAQPAREEALFVIAQAHQQSGALHARNFAAQKTDESRKKATESAARSYEEALTAYRSHLKKVESTSSSKAEMRRRQIASARFITAIALDPIFNRPEEAFEGTEGAVEKFADSPRDLTTILVNRVTARVRMVKSDDPSTMEAAENELKELLVFFDRDKGYPEDVAGAAFSVANKMIAVSKAVEKDDAARAAALNDRTSEIFQKATGMVDINNIKEPALLISIGLRLFSKAEKKRDPESYQAALDFFSAALGKGIEKTTRDALQRYVTTCYVGTGQYDEALQQARAITADDPEMRRIWAWEMLADIQRVRLKALQKEGVAKAEDARKAGDEASTIYGRLAKILFAANRKEQDFWRLRTKYMYVLFEYDLDKVHAVLKGEIQRNPRFDEGAFVDEDGIKLQVKFKELIRKYNAAGTSKPLPDLPPDAPEGQKPPDAPKPPEEPKP